MAPDTTKALTAGVNTAFNALVVQKCLPVHDLSPHFKKKKARNL